MKRITLHETTPNQRDINLIADEMRKGALVIFPTDSVYAIGCIMDNKTSIDRILKITGKAEKKSKLSLFVRGHKEVAEHTLPLDNDVFKTMKQLTPGPYTFILNADKSVTKYFKNNKKDIGIRIPDHEVLQALLAALGRPIITTSLNIKDEGEKQFLNPDVIEESFRHTVDYFLDCGVGVLEQTTILDCTGDSIEVVRMGKGAV